MSVYAYGRDIEVEASKVKVGDRVVLTGKDGQGTYKGLAQVVEVQSGTATTLLVTLWTGKRTIYRRWDTLWLIRVATPID